jgi:hypothetical protein
MLSKAVLPVSTKLTATLAMRPTPTSHFPASGLGIVRKAVSFLAKHAIDLLMISASLVMPIELSLVEIVPASHSTLLTMLPQPNAWLAVIS